MREKASRPLKSHIVLPRLLENARKLRQTPTDAKALMWFLLRNRKFGGVKFRRQHPISNYVLDFYAPEAKLAIELDGGQHVENSSHDAQRTKELNAQGIRILRFWNHEVFNETEAVLPAIWNALFPDNDGHSSISPSPRPSPAGRGGARRVLPLDEGN